MHDLVVIGGGPGGYATAFRAVARGLDVALIEAEQLGGTCLHRGCIPSKANLHVASFLEEMERSEGFGVQLAYDGIDGERLSAFRGDVVAKMHQGLEHLVGQRTTLVRGRGRVERGHNGSLAVEVTAADGTTSSVQARHVVLATGSRPRALPGVEIDGEVVQSSDEAVWFTQAPRRAVIIGAGAIGMEFASMWAPMGTEVAIVEALDRVLPLEDPDCSAAVTKAYRTRGIEVVTSAKVVGVSRQHASAEVTVEVEGRERVIEADRVLIATGRLPATENTGAAELGLLDDRGYVVTDEWGATQLDGVWAVGDIRPNLALAHAAFAEGFAVADRIAGTPHAQPVDHVHTPRVTFCHPEVASVGLTEEEARRVHGAGRVGTTVSSLRHNARGLLAGAEGFVKLVFARPGGGSGADQEGPVLGVHIVGPHATDLIAEASLATSWEALPSELAAITHAHPTLYEALGEAFQVAAGTPFHG